MLVVLRVLVCVQAFHFEPWHVQIIFLFVFWWAALILNLIYGHLYVGSFSLTLFHGFCRILVDARWLNFRFYNPKWLVLLLPGTQWFASCHLVLIGEVVDLEWRLLRQDRHTLTLKHFRRRRIAFLKRTLSCTWLLRHRFGTTIRFRVLEFNLCCSVEALRLWYIDVRLHWPLRIIWSLRANTLPGTWNWWLFLQLTYLYRHWAQSVEIDDGHLLLIIVWIEVFVVLLILQFWRCLLFLQDGRIRLISIIFLIATGISLIKADCDFLISSTVLSIFQVVRRALYLDWRNQRVLHVWLLAVILDEVLLLD